MRILINAANLSTGGGLNIGMAIIQSWLQRTNTLLVLASPELANALTNAGIPQTYWIHVQQRPGRSLTARRAFRKLADQTVRTFRPDVVFTVFGPSLWRPQAPHLCGFANGLYLSRQPVRPYGHRSRWTSTSIHRLRRKLLFNSLRQDTDVLWVETEYARQQLRSLLRDKPIFVVPNELSAAFEEATFRSQMSIQHPFRVLMPAAAYPHKNFALLQALLKFPEATDLQFVVTLPPPDFDRLFPDAPKPHNLGYLTGPELALAYEQADVIFTPSLAEIYSATWLEAMAAGRPLVCVDIPEARDLCGNAALYCNGHNPQEALTMLMDLRADPALRATQVENGRDRLQVLKPTIARTDALYQLLSQTIALQAHS